MYCCWLQSAMWPFTCLGVNCAHWKRQKYGVNKEHGPVFHTQMNPSCTVILVCGQPSLMANFLCILLVFMFILRPLPQTRCTATFSEEFHDNFDSERSVSTILALFPKVYLINGQFLLCKWVVVQERFICIYVCNYNRISIMFYSATGIWCYEESQSIA